MHLTKHLPHFSTQDSTEIGMGPPSPEFMKVGEPQVPMWLAGTRGCTRSQRRKDQEGACSFQCRAFHGGVTTLLLSSGGHCFWLHTTGKETEGAFGAFCSLEPACPRAVGILHRAENEVGACFLALIPALLPSLYEPLAGEGADSPPT